MLGLTIWIQKEPFEKKFEKDSKREKNMQNYPAFND